jgi:hypothetical protein
LSRGLPKRENLEATVTRTLLASGYCITGADRHHHHVEFECERRSRLGVLIRFRIAFTDLAAFNETDVKAIQRTAKAQGRASILVAKAGRPGQISLNEFLNAMGGPIPSWRALNDNYGPALVMAAKNRNPKGMVGEPWALLEDLTADGLEFLLGHRVSQFGGRRRGLRVSDMLCQLPDSSLLVVDAKAYTSGLNVTWPSLRPLKEYVEQQLQYQAGRIKIASALIVSSSFHQNANRLQSISKEFFGETRVPLTLMKAETLAAAVDEFKRYPDIRNSIHWGKIFSGGVVIASDVKMEIKRVMVERFDPKDL